MTESSRVNHVLLTRFNLPSAGVESGIRARDGWLDDRVDLFERYCLPSVRAQSNQNFSWIIYFDPQSPAWLLNRIDGYATEGVCRPIFRATVDRPQLLADVRAASLVERDLLITTNLDNDDGLAVDFVDRLQRAEIDHPRAAVYLTNGLISSQDGLYLRRDRHNAFCSVRESSLDPVTCWSDWHNLLGRSMPVVELGGEPAWLQVVHGANVSNRVRGTLVSPLGYQDAFAPVLGNPSPGNPAVGNLAVPSRGRLLRDRLVDGPIRGCREASRAGVKWLLMATVGKRGLDRIKLLRPAGGRRSHD
jgi:N-acetylglucosaminyl-diphospho-decaprenol L-rhamnosyltransferase